MKGNCNILFQLPQSRDQHLDILTIHSPKDILQQQQEQTKTIHKLLPK